MTTTFASVPDNQNIAQASKFKLNFSRLPEVTFFCTRANFPGVSTSPVPHTTPFIDLFVPGDKMIYEDFTVDFLIDEDYTAWKTIHDWIRGMTFPTDFREYRDLWKLNRIKRAQFPTERPQYSDAELSLYTNRSVNNVSIKFIDLFPVSLTSVQLDAGRDSDDILVGTAAFKFAHYEISKL